MTIRASAPFPAMRHPLDGARPPIHRQSLRLPFALATLLGVWCVLAAPVARGVEAPRPRSIAVFGSKAAHTTLMTSLTTEWVYHLQGAPGSWVDKPPVDVGGGTYGVTFVQDGSTLTGNYAVVTHMDKNALTLLYRTTSNGAFSAVPLTYSGVNFSHSTGVLADPSGSPVLYVANRGVGALSEQYGSESWRNLVYKVSLFLDFEYSYIESVDVVQVDRDPREMAMSPMVNGERRLFVAHIQGTLGHSSSTTDGQFDTFDGGSIVAIDPESFAVTKRYEIGSPVRDVLVVPVPGTGDVRYRVYCTSVGDGAQGENPDIGGRNIANVITSFGIDESHDAIANDRQDVLLHHTPDFSSPSSGDAPLDPADAPAVVPETMAYVPQSVQLFVTNSGSGSVSVINLDADRRISVQAQTFDLTVGGRVPEVTGRTTTGLPQLTPSASSGVQGLTQFQIAAPATFKILSTEGSAVTTASPSAPRGIVLSASAKVLVVEQLDGEVSYFSTGSSAQRLGVKTLPASSWSVDDDELNFFTAGDGFDFREALVQRVDNLACGTCHPDGHLDGKIRLTVSKAASDAPVAVPSNADVGDTDWIFFDGLTTILDNLAVNPSCDYCNQREFFEDTRDFTAAFRTERSPFALPAQGSVDDVLSQLQLLGRAWFDQLNCSRCHVGTTASFDRTAGGIVEQLDGSGAIGPLTSGAIPGRINRLLHDGTHSFVWTSEVPVVTFGISVRNATNVGNRIVTQPSITQGRVPAVNTPALAGAWDNRPYMHDGRYTTLRQVIENTYVAPDTIEPERIVAAPIWRAPFPADNFMAEGGDDTSPFNFATHSTNPPANPHQPLADYLSSIQQAGAMDRLIDFMSGLSSFTDPCSGGDLVISDENVDVDVVAGTATISWTTSYPVACTLTLNPNDPNPLTVSFLPATQFSHVAMNLTENEEYSVDIDAKRPRGVCLEELDSATLPWTQAPGKRAFAANGVARSEALLIASPTPFNPSTVLSFYLGAAAQTELTIYDIRGSRVATLVNGSLGAGEHEYVWKGRDERGAKVASGVYLAQLHVDGKARSVRKIALVE